MRKFLISTVAFLLLFCTTALLMVRAQNIGGANSSGNLTYYGLWTFLLNGIGSTPTDSVFVKNTTLAAAGAQQFSPSIHWQGQGWNSAAGASQSIDLTAYLVPFQNAGSPGGELRIATQTNGGGYSDKYHFDIFGNLSIAGNFNAVEYATQSFCAANGTAANPSVASCGSAAAGMFSCATNASGATCQVNTTAVTANSEISITQNAADGGASQLNVTCNTASDLPSTKPILLSKSGGTSFTINVGTITSNPACFEYIIIN